MVFSTAYYSPLTLLPLDPPPFTIPTAAKCPSKNRPTVTLDDYPLPDGSWKWASRAWMIDMRGDGEVQYDGFEYARSFRSKKWGPDTGFMSNRGLVRRRRWIRLMMRPAQFMHEAESLLGDTGVSVVPELEHHEEGATRPPSVMLILSEDGEQTRVWRGDEGDWDRCHDALRQLTRDGRILEFWAHWLGVSNEAATVPRSSLPILAVSPFLVRRSWTTKNREEGKQVSSGTSPTEDVTSTKSLKTQDRRPSADVGAHPTQAPKEYVAAVVRRHVRTYRAVYVVIHLLIRVSSLRVRTF